MELRLTTRCRMTSCPTFFALKERIRFFRRPRTPPCWIADITTEFARVARSKMDATGGLGQNQFGYGFEQARNVTDFHQFEIELLAGMPTSV